MEDSDLSMVEHSDSEPTVGMCLHLCPPSEQKFRTDHCLVHHLEKDGKFVKAYKRSAAGDQGCDPKLIRPPSVLQETIHYLYNYILVREDVPFYFVYQFVDDRLKSIKQDLFRQQPKPEDGIPVLEPLVRFYAVSAYLLCDADLHDFDPVLNHNTLLETLKWLLRLYDACSYLSVGRAEMEALYLLLNLGDSKALTRSIALPRAVREDSFGLVSSAEKMSLAWVIGNFNRVCRLIRTLPLTQAALTCAVQLPVIKRFGVRVYNSAYSCRNVEVPLAFIQNQLLFNTEQEVGNYCRLCGLATVDDDIKTVKFSKSHWNDSSAKIPVTKIKFIEENMKFTLLSDLLLNPPLRC